MAKQIYKLRNWSEYNKNLVERGSINFWFPEETTMCWYHNSATKQKGGQLIYSDLAIITCLIIRRDMILLCVRHKVLFNRYQV